MRYLARMQPEEKMAWLDKARMEAPHRREIWLDLAEEFHAKADWLNLFWACTNGIEKTHRTGSYLDDAALLGVPAVRSGRDRGVASQRDGPRGRVGTQGARARSGQSAA